MKNRVIFLFNFVIISFVLYCTVITNVGFCQDAEQQKTFKYKQRRISRTKDTQKNRKIRVAVSRFEDKTEVKGSLFNVIEEEDKTDVSESQINISDSTVTIKTDVDEEKEETLTEKQLLTGLLIDKLRKTGIFDVVERDEINQLMREINFESSNWVKQNNVNKIGNIYSVQSIITGEVLQNKDGHRIGSGLYTVALRLYNVNTGEIIASATSSENSLDLAIERGILIIADETKGKPWTCRIVSIKEGFVYINAGDSDDIEEKDVFSVIRLGDEIVDPQNNKILGYERSTLAKIRVVEIVNDKLSKAEIIEKKGDIKVDDIVSAKKIDTEEDEHSSLWIDTFGKKDNDKMKENTLKKSALSLKNNLSLSGVEDIVREYGGSIVSVFSGEAQGSGFIISSDGYIVTNSHVVNGDSSVTIKMIEENKVYSNVQVVKDNKIRDIALLKINSNDSFAPVMLGDSDSAVEGERIVALGNPKGLENTVSDGLVSSIREMDGTKVLQISAPISSGSSGGPLFNMRGEVIGVTTFTIVEGQNLNFAISINYVKEELVD
ncbi:MAG: trypsin-like peptidase domain-containing protein [Candidatus Zapsychrus exili]|nr:trypsin-like peptidase domain-containing protein [Candidatus Zapsychrus exili]